MRSVGCTKGFKVKDLRFREMGVGFRVYFSGSIGFRVQGWGSRAQCFPKFGVPLQRLNRGYIGGFWVSGFKVPQRSI